jgi:SAM-dependent methyltransferase
VTAETNPAAYGPASYGDAFADVYDEWYGPSPTMASSDLSTTVTCLTTLAAGGPVLELGVGTGRIAIALAERGLSVHGVDASAQMLAKLAEKPNGHLVTTSCSDMAANLPDGAFQLIFVAVNTLFNLTTAAAQRRCLALAAQRLSPGGHVVVEAFVPDPAHSAPVLSVRSVEADHVVLMVSRTDPIEQVVIGQMVELRDNALPRLKPWQIRYATPAQIDELAESAGLFLTHRWANWSSDSFTTDSTHHVSVYALRT